MIPWKNIKKKNMSGGEGFFSPWHKKSELIKEKKIKTNMYF